ncbi:hypothetical protein Y032_0481g2257 [Ancylostoma ceylanicum]|uniref:Uncharacterized protein n=1 Tax=Ancylostoma ceylanicum TaxID=53326 RepID=A0A016WXL4_9BILA|nr:hypothetical protein Y032_0481g2257 [Ancylostoma ceylanicum]
MRAKRASVEVWKSGVSRKARLVYSVLLKNIEDSACGFSALRLQNRGGTYTILSLGACFLRVPCSGSAAMVQSRNQSIFLRRTVYAAGVKYMYVD